MSGIRLSDHNARLGGRVATTGLPVETIDRNRKRRWQTGCPALWLRTEGGGGGSGKRKNEKTPVLCRITRDDGKEYVQISTEDGELVCERKGSWVRRENVCALHSFYETMPGHYEFVTSHYEYSADVSQRGIVVIYRDGAPIRPVTTIEEANIWLSLEIAHGNK